MKGAGFGSGLDLNCLHTTLSEHRKGAEVLQSLWGKFGINATLQPTDDAASR